MAQHSFWVIVDGQTPTSFRSRQQEDLLPTLTQLKRTQPDVRLMWFERGRLWASPTEAREALIVRRKTPTGRHREWRPGGDHVDPRAKYAISRDEKRARFKARAIRDRRDGTPQSGASDAPEGQGPAPRPDRPPFRPHGRPPFRPHGERPFGSDRPDRRPPFRGRSEGGRPFGDRPPGDRRPPSDRQRGDRPPGDRPHGDRPPVDRSRDDRRDTRPPGTRPHGDKWRGDRPRGDRSPLARPHGDRPFDRPRGDRPPRDDRPRGDRPPFDRPRDDRPQGDRPPKGPWTGGERSGDRPKKFGDRPWRPKKPGQTGRPWRPKKPKGDKGGG